MRFTRANQAFRDHLVLKADWPVILLKASMKLKPGGIRAVEQGSPALTTVYPVDMIRISGLIPKIFAVECSRFQPFENGTQVCVPQSGNTQQGKRKIRDG